MGCHFLLQGIFLTQELNPGLLHCRQILYQLSYEGSPHRQEYWSGVLPFPSPGHRPDPGIEPESLMSPALPGGCFITGTILEPHLAWRGEPPGFSRVAAGALDLRRGPQGPVLLASGTLEPEDSPEISCQ